MNFKNLVAVAAAAVLSLCTSYAGAQTTATGEPKIFAGTVEINSTQLAFIISGSAGGGTLEFQGKEYKFSIGGLGVGGVGVKSLNAVGAVYNLTDVSKFPGSFVQARAGATLGRGKGNLALSNNNGVIMELKFSSEGVALSVGADGMIVSMK
jgi:hypothetical protein